MCGFLCNGTREDKQTDVGGKQTDAGNTSRKRQPPEYGRLSCPIDALSSFGALEYFKGKDEKRVRAPGGERDKAHARTGAVQVAGEEAVVDVAESRGATDLARRCLTRRAAARYNRFGNAVGAGGNRGGRGAERRHDERLSDHHTGKRPGGAARVHHPEKAGTPGDRSQAGVLAERLAEGHVFRKLRDPASCAFIEYAPLETAWVPVEGKNYLYIYCRWVAGDAKGHGHGARLMESCIEEARRLGKSGVCMLGADKQKAWLSDQAFAAKYGFRPVDTAPGGYTLLALSLDGTTPHFAAGAKRGTVDESGLVVYYDDQCPFLPARVETLRAYCEEKGIQAEFRHVGSLAEAKALPSVFNNFAVFWNGQLITVNQIDPKTLEKVIGRSGGSSPYRCGAR